jgi:hypothetical protein
MPEAMWRHAVWADARLTMTGDYLHWKPNVMSYMNKMICIK